MDNISELKEIYKEINMQMLDCLSKNKVPYLNQLPPPQDMNVINGHHLGDINKIRLELKGAQINAKSLKWIYKGDADLLGLKLKDNIDNKPILMYANVNRNGNSMTESQAAYLLEQFTEDSLKKAVELTRTEDSSKTGIQKRAIAEKLLCNITEYDSGSGEKVLRENKRKNISQNLKEPSILKDVTAAFNNATQFYDNSQKVIFNSLNNFYILQETGLNLKGHPDEKQINSLKKALETVAKVDSPRLTLTITDCFLYSERLTHYGFSPERVYTKEDLTKSLNVFSPSAANFEPKNNPAVHLENNIEKNREREHEIKPRHITHQRGM